MLFRDDHPAARQEAFRRAAPNRVARWFGPEFDHAFEVWDAKRRLCKRLISLLLVVATVTIGGVFFLRFSPLTAHDTCLDAGEQWTQGQCDSAD
ncbi:hypothetical protein [Caulobacter sp. DWR2-3-1b2]|uniref:hypothetical protein n=1 Tax=Caulobacter sp. DWR2-3-1b2 TaxID=2804642 RepID=UPI003CE95B58